MIERLFGLNHGLLIRVKQAIHQCCVEARQRVTPIRWTLTFIYEDNTGKQETVVLSDTAPELPLKERGEA